MNYDSKLPLIMGISMLQLEREKEEGRRKKERRRRRQTTKQTLIICCEMITMINSL